MNTKNQKDSIKDLLNKIPRDFGYGYNFHLGMRADKQWEAYYTKIVNIDSPEIDTHGVYTCKMSHAMWIMDYNLETLLKKVLIFINKHK